MDWSPYTYVNASEDSGLGESSRNDSNPSNLYTPTIISRKRKCPEQHIIKSVYIKQTPDSTQSSPWVINPEILSSTLNESLTAGVEKCKLDYYVERSDLDNSTDYSFLKNIKEPSTPRKYSMKQYCNAKPSPVVSSMVKLGSPERNDILYHNLVRNPSSRFSDNKRSSPAKKCLFTRSSLKDPVMVLCTERNTKEIMLKIFSFLSDESLYSCSKVSKGWKSVIMGDEKLKHKLQLFIQDKIMNKENCNYSSPCLIMSPCYSLSKQSTPIAEEASKMYEITNSLTEGQHLEKCISCNKPVAIVEQNISQCTSYSCGVIRCLKCNSISKTGPENFIDSCQQSMLLIEKPSSRYEMLGSPKRYQNENGLPTIFLDNSVNTSHTMNSSGYLTDPDLSHTSHRRSSLTKEKADISQVLKICNSKPASNHEQSWERRNSIVPVVPSTKKREEIVEPSSPPKVKHVACSKKSKKLLKRLVKL